MSRYILCLMGVMGILGGVLRAEEPKTATTPHSGERTVASSPAPAPIPAPTSPAPASPEVAKPAPVDPAVEKIKQIARKIQGDLETLRNITFNAPIKLEVLSRKEIQQFLEKMVEKQIQSPVWEAQCAVMEHLGALPGNIDYQKALLEMMSEQVMGCYDDKNHTLLLVNDELLVAQAESVIAHELTHAYQDQELNTTGLLDATRWNDDELMAHKAFLEGEATLVQYAYLFHVDLTALPSMSGLFREALSLQSDKLQAFHKTPKFIQELFLFPYLEGADLAHLIYKTNEGWAGFKKRYQDLPVSTRQILHPDHYVGKTRDLPVKVTFPDLAAVLAPRRLLHANCMGELQTRLVLATDGNEAASAAEGWKGDYYQAWTGEGEPLSFLWYTTWESPLEARKFAGAWLARMEKRFGAAAAAGETSSTWTGPAFFSQLERRGSDVLVVEQAPLGSRAPLLEQLWKTDKKSAQEAPTSGGGGMAQRPPEGKKEGETKTAGQEPPSRASPEGLVKDTVGGFELQLPKESLGEWGPGEAGGENPNVRLYLVNKTTKAALDVSAVPLPPGLPVTLDSLLAMQRSKATLTVKEYREESSRELTVAGQAAREVVYAGMVEGREGRCRFRSVFLLAPGKMISLNLTSPYNFYGESNILFTRILESLKLSGPASASSGTSSAPSPAPATLAPEHPPGKPSVPGNVLAQQIIDLDRTIADLTKKLEALQADPKTPPHQIESLRKLRDGTRKKREELVRQEEEANKTPR